MTLHSAERKNSLSHSPISFDSPMHLDSQMYTEASMDQNRILEVLDSRPAIERQDSRWCAAELQNRLLTLSARELDWVLELVSFLKEEAWQAEHEEIARTVAAILVPKTSATLRP